MTSHSSRLKQSMALSLLALSLAACGMGPDVNTDDAATGSRITHQEYNGAALSREESLLRDDASCGMAPHDLRGVINEAVYQFNQRVASTWNLVYLAAHPDSVHGISVRICDDDRLAAYAYPRTVAIHSGLLRELRNMANDDETFLAATAFVLYHELGHVELGHTDLMTEGLLFSYSDPLKEQQADAFAAAASRQAGFSIAGADLVFLLLEQLNPHGSLGHPANRRQLLSPY